MFEKHAVKISYGNEQLAKDNYESFKKLGQPIIPIHAIHNNKTATKLPANDMGDLSPTLLPSKGAKVMLTKNLWTDAGLCNGSMGTVKDIIYKDGDSPPALQLQIVVQSDNNYIGPSCCDDTSNCVPIPPVTSISDSLGSSYERQQYPLRLSWSITIDKSQGLTLNKAWIDLGKSEKVAGPAYVALSRVHKLDDLVIEPMTFERLKSITKLSNFKYRFQEEVSLTNTAERTMSRINRN